MFLSRRGSRRAKTIDRNLTEVAVELPRKAETARHAAHCCGDEVIEITVRRGGQLQSSEADVIQGLVVQKETFISICNKLVKAQNCIVWLDDRIGNFGRGDDRERLHNTIRVLLADLRDQQRTHA